jgi:hypothetical protein
LTEERETTPPLPIEEKEKEEVQNKYETPSPVFLKMETVEGQPKKNKKQRTKKPKIIKTTAKGNNKTKKQKKTEPELILVTQDTSI